MQIANVQLINYLWMKVKLLKLQLQRSPVQRDGSLLQGVWFLLSGGVLVENCTARWVEQLISIWWQNKKIDEWLVCMQNKKRLLHSLRISQEPSKTKDSFRDNCSKPSIHATLRISSCGCTERWHAMATIIKKIFRSSSYVSSIHNFLEKKREEHEVHCG